MKYHDGQAVRVGDTVDAGGGVIGTVVCIIENGKTVPQTAGEWEFLGSGVVINTVRSGDVYFELPDEDTLLLTRAAEAPL